ncbi:hypothetical protein PF001_g25063 [Phytophthora fragariae]|uniref:RxLR effector protein n=1 Tax=Phytophthora fragariae TaxID=53985 RepID=A0A6A4BQD6_9STRA|nr:hypothetical protein PF003_g17715 [Phytophthora fragariae]KAE9278663.1 hypothetical protein PF001_g25063 [Phytophthora fragariae]
MIIALPTLTSPAFISVSIAVCMLSGVAPSASVAESWSALLVSSSESASDVTDTSINPASRLITLVLTRSRSVPASAVPGASPPSFVPFSPLVAPGSTSSSSTNLTRRSAFSSSCSRAAAAPSPLWPSCVRARTARTAPSPVSTSPNLPPLDFALLARRPPRCRPRRSPLRSRRSGPPTSCTLRRCSPPPGSGPASDRAGAPMLAARFPVGRPSPPSPGRLPPCAPPGLLSSRHSRVNSGPLGRTSSTGRSSGRRSHPSPSVVVGTARCVSVAPRACRTRRR